VIAFISRASHFFRYNPSRDPLSLRHRHFRLWSIRTGVTSRRGADRGAVSSVARAKRLVRSENVTER
jgi:hypothetical protein